MWIEVALCVLACGQDLDRRPSSAQKKETVAFLHSLSLEDGGFRSAPGESGPNLRATSSCIRALKYFGGKARDPEKSKSFILSCWNPEEGGFSDVPRGKLSPVSTAVGLMGVREFQQVPQTMATKAVRFLEENARGFEDIRMAAASLESLGISSKANGRWLQEVKKQARADGVFGTPEDEIRATGGAAACWLRLGGKLPDAGMVIRLLKNGQNEDGAYSKSKNVDSDLETSYRVVRSLHMLKEQPARKDALIHFISRCRNRDGGYGVAPGMSSTASGTYFAGILLHWLETP